jgi:hypothetical protein
MWFSFVSISTIGFGDYYPSYSGVGAIFEFASVSFGLALCTVGEP